MALAVVFTVRLPSESSLGVVISTQKDGRLRVIKIEKAAHHLGIQLGDYLFKINDTLLPPHFKHKSIPKLIKQKYPHPIVFHFWRSLDEFKDDHIAVLYQSRSLGIKFLVKEMSMFHLPIRVLTVKSIQMLSAFSGLSRGDVILGINYDPLYGYKVDERRLSEMLRTIKPPIVLNIWRPKAGDHIHFKDINEDHKSLLDVQSYTEGYYGIHESDRVNKDLEHETATLNRELNNCWPKTSEFSKSPAPVTCYPRSPRKFSNFKRFFILFHSKQKKPEEKKQLSFSRRKSFPSASTEASEQDIRRNVRESNGLGDFDLTKNDVMPYSKSTTPRQNKTPLLGEFSDFSVSSKSSQGSFHEKQLFLKEENRKTATTYQSISEYNSDENLVHEFLLASGTDQLKIARKAGEYNLIKMIKAAIIIQRTWRIFFLEKCFLCSSKQINLEQLDHKKTISLIISAIKKLQSYCRGRGVRKHFQTHGDQLINLKLDLENLTNQCPSFFNKMESTNDEVLLTLPTNQNTHDELNDQSNNLSVLFTTTSNQFSREVYAASGSLTPRSKIKNVI